MGFDASTLNRHGYDLIGTDTTGAEILFHLVLEKDPNNFCALFGLVYAHLNHLEHQQGDTATAIGVYLVTCNDVGNWELTAENLGKADYYTAYLDRAIENAPREMHKKLKLFRNYNVTEAGKLVDQMIAL